MMPSRRVRSSARVPLAVLVLVGAAVLVVVVPWQLRIGAWRSGTAGSGAAPNGEPTAAELAHLSLGERVVAFAESQLGYRTDPPNTYCNRFSAYWVSGPADCGNGNRNEEWCADFAAWAWQKAGALVDYQYVSGDLNSSSASFYEWGVDHGTWHPVGSGYVPQPGDVAVYGLDATGLVAQHVAIVTGFTPGARGPNVINGDGDKTGFSVVERGYDQYSADTHTTHAANAGISGYVSPTPA